MSHDPNRSPGTCPGPFQVAESLHPGVAEVCSDKWRSGRFIKQLDNDVYLILKELGEIWSAKALPRELFIMMDAVIVIRYCW